ncbi:MAG TPA: hypothetical protein VG839_05560, partial [Asticcacaulis sp.]|nr:hypothetical protein [Asticcacaulis sp.]
MASRDPRKLLGAESAVGLFDPDTRTVNKRNVSVVTAFPLLLIPVLVYNILAIISLWGGADAAYMATTQIMFRMPMPAPDTHWAVSTGDFILFGSLICLFFELLKSTQSDKVAIINHSLSMVLFIVCLVEFLLLRPFATSTFFLLT